MTYDDLGLPKAAEIDALAVDSRTPVTRVIYSLTLDSNTSTTTYDQLLTTTWDTQGPKPTPVKDKDGEKITKKTRIHSTDVDINGLCIPDPGHEIPILASGPRDLPGSADKGLSLDVHLKRQSNEGVITVAGWPTTAAYLGPQTCILNFYVSNSEFTNLATATPIYQILRLPSQDRLQLSFQIPGPSGLPGTNLTYFAVGLQPLQSGSPLIENYRFGVHIPF